MSKDCEFIKPKEHTIIDHNLQSPIQEQFVIFYSLFIWQNNSGKSFGGPSSSINLSGYNPIYTLHTRIHIYIKK